MTPNPITAAASICLLRTSAIGHVTHVVPLVRTLQQAALAHEGAAPDVGPMEPLQLLGRRVAELHLSLARHTGHPAFDPEPVRSSDLLHWAA